ncbi:hypothetical protein J921_2190 [Acinetobacter baumannii 25493_8]|uniref:Uncharacterized protein n=1 Tax=Yersinia pestis biovar Orientalis str. IP275 TaxID=373665 RepID=A0AAV3BFP1_YERPE|nr:hypothetical protein YPIP275_2847 [Yersinia pestis biovar Orientalis str. IP275]EXD80426.1 hypothetical protein J460_0218 [Acinetobacter baumannii 942133]EYD36473.1 hypothetical protein J921_2190 [Acinetobacter baumannii 25493_8]EYD53607.1 hypothetical protein J916_3584 [Acinetobacter baumannii 25493_3]EYS53289.1 hypothetical protein K007_0313 [Acinetobacter baumannii 25569_1]
MLLVSPEGLVEQLDQRVKSAVQEAKPIHLVADVTECLPSSDRTLVSTGQTFHIELIRFLNHFGDEIVTQALNLAVKAFGVGLIFVHRLDHEHLVLKANPLLDRFLWKGSGTDSSFILRVLLTPFIHGFVVTFDEILFQLVKLKVYVIQLVTDFIGLADGYGKSVHERHTEFQQEATSFCFQAMKAFQLSRITDLLTSQLSYFLRWNFTTLAQLEIRCRQTGLSTPDVKVYVDNTEAL